MPDFLRSQLTYCCEVHWRSEDLVGGPRRKRLRQGAIPDVHFSFEVEVLFNFVRSAIEEM